MNTDILIQFPKSLSLEDLSYIKSHLQGYSIEFNQNKKKSDHIVLVINSKVAGGFADLLAKPNKKFLLQTLWRLKMLSWRRSNGNSKLMINFEIGIGFGSVNFDLGELEDEISFTNGIQSIAKSFAILESLRMGHEPITIEYDSKFNGWTKVSDSTR